MISRLATPFRRHARQEPGWGVGDIPDQAGRVFVVTGANSGIGLETARALDRVGATVVLACRNGERGQAAADAIGGRARHLPLDLADLASVRNFVRILLAEYPDVDVLVNNAGAMLVPQANTPQGLERHFATNVVGPFLLTTELLPAIRDRVVWVGSKAHKRGRMVFDDLQFTDRKYSKWAAYAQSKLGSLILAYEVQRRLEADGSPLRSVAAHPGWASTNIGRAPDAWYDRVVIAVNERTNLGQSPANGALPTLYAATMPDLPGGSYVGPDGFAELRGAPTLVAASDAARDPVAGRRLWQLCEALTYPVTGQAAS